MIYPDKRGVALMGENGFIGATLESIREELPPAVYFFDSPSSNILFDQNLDYCMEETIFSFLKTIQWCRDNNYYLVFPSSATIYNKNTSYARCKAVLEEIAQSYDVKFLGLRIAAGYGPGEGHKGKYSSVIYQWVRDMRKDIAPVIFGDGTQTRDFIYEDDIAATIALFARQKRLGFYDVGTGLNTSFNQVVQLINEVLGKDIKPKYVSKPKHYVPETLVRGVECTVSLKEGISAINDHLKLLDSMAEYMKK